MNNFLVFVTVELYPLSTGEIGKLLINLLSAISEMDRARTIVILADEALDLRLARTTYPDVCFEGLDDVAEIQESDRYPPKNAYRHTSEWHWRSVCVLRKLLQLEQEGLVFDYIEFPDYGGLGFAATQEKLFEGAFAHATLAIRLHGTEGIVRSTEASSTGRSTLATYDIERKSLRDCDRVIAPSMPVADHYCSFYGYDLSEWVPRIVLHSFPVLVDNAGIAKSCAVSSDMPLLFLSGLHRAKAPDIFVRACVGFMRLCAEYAGEVHFLSEDRNPDVVAYVEKLIPSDLSYRFKFHDSPIPRAQCEQLISQGVSVYSSPWESFCLAAFEASLLGGRVLLNGANPAFGDYTPWGDDENCIKFDGTVESLVGRLQHLFREAPELTLVSPPSEVVPWRTIVPPVEPTGIAETGPVAPLVSVIIPNFNLGAYLPYTLGSVAASGYPNIEIIVCDDASTDPITIALLGRLENDFKDRSLKIVYAKYNRGLAGARNLAIRKAQGKYVLTLDADDLISPEFIAKAVGALERNPDYSIVVPQTAYFAHERNEIPQTQSEYIDFLLFYGEALANGFFDNRFSTATVLAHRALFDELKYREDLRAWEDWDFYLRAVIAGKRFIVTNELHFFYRRRQNSMISEVANDPRYMALCYYDLRRVQSIQSGHLSFPVYAISAWEEVLVAEFSNAEIRRLTDESQALRKTASEQDVQITNLNQAVSARDRQIVNMSLALAEIRESTSWKLTQPVRFIGQQRFRANLLRKGLPYALKMSGGALPLFKHAFRKFQLEGWDGIKRRIIFSASPGSPTPVIDYSGLELPRVHFEQINNDYDRWIKLYDTLTDRERIKIKNRIGKWANLPLVSVLMPVFNPPINMLRDAIESVQRQLYPFWELCIADDASTDLDVKDLLRDIAANDSRIKVIFRETNGHISAASNSALDLVNGRYVTLLDNDDVLTEHALFWTVDAIINNPEAGLIYSDEDKITQEGRRFDPYFKPDWNPDLFLSHNMVCHLGVYRVDLVKEVGGFREGYEGAQDYDLALRCIEKLEARQIVHIPRVLYHWRSHPGSTAQAGSEKSYALLAGARALNDHFLRVRVSATAELLDMGMYRARYTIPAPAPLISLIIPTRNGLNLIRQCIDSIISKTTYKNYEIIIVDNGSDDRSTLAYFDSLVDNERIRILRDDRPFNYSALNNSAVRQAKGEYIGLINNDIEVISPDWLEEMMSLAIQPDVGAVGARLWYPNDTLQHGGVIVGIGGIAGHSHKYLPKGAPGYFGRAQLIQTLSAVTAACLVVKRSIYQEIEGLDEVNLTVAFNDVDFCLRLREAGYRNVWTPYAELYHHESATRGTEDNPEKQQRFVSEVFYMKERWGDSLKCDPAYSMNLTLEREDFSLAWPPRVDLLK